MQMITNDQKAKIISKKMKGVKSLNKLTQSLKGATLLKADVTFSNAQISGVGFEPEIVGSIFSGLKDGQITVPLTGNIGVFVLQLEKTVTPPKAANYLVEKNQLLKTLKNSVQGSATKALVKEADVVDNRRFFQNNIRR